MTSSHAAGVTTRAEAKQRTRERLVEAGLALAERTGLTGMSTNQVVAEAGVAKGSFFHHFVDRASYLVALHQRFHDRLLAQIVVATEPLRPGPERLLAGSFTYLDACLRNRGVRAFLLEIRAVPVVGAEVNTRNGQIAELCEPDFTAMGWPCPHEAALLWVVMVAEAALVELAARRRQPPVRDALRWFIRTG